MQYAFGKADTPPVETCYEKKQVHGNRCVEITQKNQNCGEADGFWTRLPKFKINVVTADCIPLLLYRPDDLAVAALHAGWRGTFARIAESFFKSLPADLADPGEWKAILGPSIRADCYEVSEELIADFKAQFPDVAPETLEPAHRHLDLIEVNRQQLKQLGMSSVEIHPDCTYCARDESGAFKYRSYRRGDRQSRQVSWIEIG